MGGRETVKAPGFVNHLILSPHQGHPHRILEIPGVGNMRFSADPFGYLAQIERTILGTENPDRDLSDGFWSISRSGGRCQKRRMGGSRRQGITGTLLLRTERRQRRRRGREEWFRGLMKDGFQGGLQILQAKDAPLVPGNFLAYAGEIVEGLIGKVHAFSTFEQGTNSLISLRSESNSSTETLKNTPYFWSTTNIILVIMF